MMRFIDAMNYRKTLEEEKWFHSECGNQEIVQGIEIAIVDLGDTPTIEAKPVIHAYWKRQKMFPNACLYHCSNCEHPEMRKYNYCPNCGAKTDLEEPK